MSVVFDVDPLNRDILRARVDDVDLEWRWRLSDNPVSVDWLLEQLHTLVSPIGAEAQPEDLKRGALHGQITRLVLEHYVPGDIGYESPNMYRETDRDRLWAFEEKRYPGTFAQVSAGLRYQHEREVRLLKHEIKMLRRELGERQGGSRA
jgi:hypothetical protein